MLKRTVSGAALLLAALMILGTSSALALTAAAVSPVQITKTFGATTIPRSSGSTSLTFAITNPDAGTQTGIGFTDVLPSGLIVASPNGLTGSCGGGTITAAAGSGSVSLAGATLAAGAQCTFAVTVHAAGQASGLQTNSVTVSSTEGGTGNTSTASVRIMAPPTITFAFGAASIPLDGTTSATVTLDNPNSAALTGVGVGSGLGALLVVAANPNVTNTCGGTVIAVAGGTSFSLSGGGIGGGGSCSFSFDVKGAVAGRESLTVCFPYSTEGGTGGGCGVDDLMVVAPPMIAKAFTPSAMAPGATSSLVLTITNPNGTGVGSLTGVGFMDNLPPSLVVASPSGLANTCGGTATATAGSGSVSLTGGTVAANAACTVTVNVTTTTHAYFSNVTNPVTSTNGGTGNQGTASLTVADPPTVAKSFPGATTIKVGDTWPMVISVQSGADSLTNVHFTDSMPAGLRGTSATGGTCITTYGGTSSASSGAVAGRVDLPASATCTFTYNVQGTTAGVKVNSVQVTANESGPGNTAQASLTVIGPPTITKAFGASSIPLNGTTDVVFTLTNPNASTALTGVGFTDPLPAGLRGTVPYHGSTTCSGFTIGFAPSGFTVSDVTIPAASTCTVTVNLTSTTAGVKNNTTDPVTSVEGGTGLASNTATLTVVAPPTITKAFSAATMPLGGTRTLTLTLQNPNATVSISGVSFIDALPAGLVVATPANASTTCSGGALGAVAGSSIVYLTGGSIGTSAACTVTVDVTATTTGAKVNVTGPVSSLEGGTGLGSNAATVTVYPPPTISSFSPTSGAPATHLTIRGTGFTGATSAAVNGTALTGMTVVDDTTITGMVSAGSTTGPVTVTTPGGTATSAGIFTVTFAPSITGFSPLSGRPGTLVTITGAGFQYVRSVTIGGKAATFSVRTPSTIVATVPAGAVTGKISVSGPYGGATSAASFIVLS